MIQAVTYILSNNVTVQGLLGLNAVKDKYKVYPVVVPVNETHPYVACRVVAAPRVGKSCYFNYTVQVSIYHDTYDEMNALAVAVRNAIEAQGAGTVNGVDFSFLNYTDQSDDFEKEHNLYYRTYTFEGTAD